MKYNKCFITWQPVLTDHQAFTYQALSIESGLPVVAYVSEMEDLVRKAQGWSDTKVSSVERRLIPKRGFLYYCFRQMYKYRKEIHIFASPFQQPSLILCMLVASFMRLEFYLISEPYSTNSDGYLADTLKVAGNIKAKLRPMLYKFYTLLLRHNVSGIFAISKLAFNQYQQSGIPKEKLFSFGYFIPTDNEASPHPLETNTDSFDGLKVIFIGSLIRRKGVDLLLDSLQNLVAQGCKIDVDIYGPGDASSIPHGNKNVNYKGLIRFGQSQKVIALYDLLVLPSRYDGWGVVVNEALCAGVPVLCSDTVGSGVVAEALGAGLTFRSGDVTSLSEALYRLYLHPSLLIKMKELVPSAAMSIQPDCGACFMYNVIKSPANLKSTIIAPWNPTGV